MAKRGPKGYNDTKIVEVLRAVEAAQAQGQTIAQALLEHDISEQTYFKWKRTYGAIDINQVKRLREIKKENARLKKLVAELGLDNAAGLWTGGAAVRKDAKEASIRAVSGEPGDATLAIMGQGLLDKIILPWRSEERRSLLDYSEQMTRDPNDFHERSEDPLIRC